MSRIVRCKCLLLLVVLTYQNNLTAQRIVVPTSAYGVWDRGDGIDDYDDPKFDYVVGIEAGDQWSNIQSFSPNKFDFSGFQRVLDKAARYKKLVKLSIIVFGKLF